MQVYQDNVYHQQQVANSALPDERQPANINLQQRGNSFGNNQVPRSQRVEFGSGKLRVARGNTGNYD